MQLTELIYFLGTVLTTPEAAGSSKEQVVDQ